MEDIVSSLIGARAFLSALESSARAVAATLANMGMPNHNYKMRLTAILENESHSSATDPEQSHPS